MEATNFPALDTSVRDIMRRDAVRLLETESAAQALARLRTENIGERIVYFYVINDRGELKGVVPTRGLLLSAPDTPVAQLMASPVISVRESDSFGNALEALTANKLLALPVVDEQGRLAGVMDASMFTETLIDLERRESAEELFQIAGVHIEQERTRNPWRLLRNRFPWLLMNIASGLAAAWISNAFTDTLRTFVALAFFIPLVLTIAESVAMQAVTISVQKLQMIGAKARYRGIARETAAGIMLGLTSGGVVALAGSVWFRLAGVTMVVAISILASAAIGAALGYFVPRLIHWWKLDPKIASGPAVLALIDVAALSCYLGLAAATL